MKLVDVEDLVDEVKLTEDPIMEMHPINEPITYPTIAEKQEDLLSKDNVQKDLTVVSSCTY